jgi:hypothetical protein
VLTLAIWKKAWRALAASFSSQSERSVSLNMKQLEALVELRSSYLSRAAEWEQTFPDVTFPMKLLLQDGVKWEWFPELSQEQIRSDLERYSNNYLIIAQEQEATLQNAHLQLIRPGIRDKLNRNAFIKARVSLHVPIRPTEIHNLLDDLNDI